MNALEAKNFEKACPKFEAASKLVPEGIGVKLMLAECYEGAGRVASAFTVYRVAEAEAARAKQEDRRVKAERRIQALEPRVPRLTILVPLEARAARGLVVKRGSNEVAPDLFGVAVPVDPGEVVIRAHADRGSFEKRITLAEGAQEQVVVQLEVQAPPPPPPALSSRPMAPGAIAGIVTIGVGGALLLTGVGLGVAAIRDEGDADAICPESTCASQEAVDLSDRANRLSIGAWVGIGAGVAAIATGVTVFVLSSRARKGEPIAGALWVSPRSVDLRLRF